MSDREELADQAAIQRVLATYCHTCDDGRFDEWAQCFTEDVRFTVMGTTQEGRATAQAWIEKAQPPERRGKHFLGQSVVDVDGDRATGTTDYVFINRTPEGGYTITSSGRYLDTFRREPDGRWRIATREIAFL